MARPACGARVVLPEPGGPQKMMETTLAGLDELGQELALAEDVVLAVDALEGPRPHPLGERRVRPWSRSFLFVSRGHAFPDYIT
ncbi:MAG: hypothetical protein MZV70_52965 [Desulfobacterales bacterium]|nr:hypothetical protein [Desulfobacterales bacterium]